MASQLHFGFGQSIKKHCGPRTLILSVIGNGSASGRTGTTENTVTISGNISGLLKASRPVPAGGHVEGPEMLEIQEQLTHRGKEAQGEGGEPLPCHQDTQ